MSNGCINSYWRVLMGELAKLIGNRVREVRKLKGLRQEDMESRGVSYRYFQRIEAGEANITLATVEKVAKALDVNPTELFTAPLSNSDEVNELYALIGDMVRKGNTEAVKKMIVFVREILL